jgi:hypothetical protein
MSKEAMKLALEALNKLTDAAEGFSVSGVYFNEGVWEKECLNTSYAAIKALEEALAKQEQGEPVGFYDARGNDICIEIPIGESADWWQPVYTTPQQRTWVGLTDIEINDLVHSHDDFDGLWEFADAVESKLKEKNT